MEAAHQLKTYADLLALPEEVHAELHAGELVTQPSGLPEHGRAKGNMGRFIGVAGTWDDAAVARVPPFEAVELPVGRLFFPRPPT